MNQKFVKYYSLMCIKQKLENNEKVTNISKNEKAIHHYKTKVRRKNDRV